MSYKNNTKQEFFILWVDDQPDAVRIQQEQIKGSFSDKYSEIDLVILESENNSDAKIKLEQNNVEIVVTDFNLEDGKGNSGLDLVSSIRRNYPAIDILFYHAGPLEKEDEKQAKNNEFIMIIEGKRNIADNLKVLIEKHLKRFNDIVFLRGMVLSNVIELELKMNEFLGVYLKIPDGRIEMFRNFVMENSANQISGKRSAIGNIIAENLDKEKKLKIRKEFASFVVKEQLLNLLQSLRYIEKTRNKLAHCKLATGRNNTVVFEGYEIEFKKSDIDSLLKKIRIASNTLDKFIKDMPSANVNEK